MAAAVLATWMLWSAVDGVYAGTASAKQPNVVIVMTDDQGYGDVGCHGNPVLKTPALDALAAQSVRLSNYHVDPSCSPTRAALMTGRYSSRTGVWHTVMGRSILHKDEITMADVFRAAGYSSGIFGKWHLGDNAPSRPRDFGFHEVLIHGGGGVGQTPDYWGNDYFDDTYLHNGSWEKFDGYCTDVFFDSAIRFIEQNREQPFFAYIPTNAAHGPFRVAEHYSKPFHELGVPSPRAEFYGMIVNIDENVARIRNKLSEWGLADNTIFVFTTDNGTAAGIRDSAGYNAGMRGVKGSEYEGGHRVPCFVHWPAGGLNFGRDVPQLTAHIDLLPTLIELCGLEPPANAAFDGSSLAPLLFDRRAPAEPPVTRPERTLFVHSQRIDHPEKWRKSAVMTERWRLVNGRELYDLPADPAQTTDVSAAHPQVVARLRREYEAWYAGISTRFDDYCRIELGSETARMTTLTCHDWHAPLRQVPWNQDIVRRSPEANGYWAVAVVLPGRYEFTLRARPADVQHPLNPGTARLKIGDVDVSQPIDEGVQAVTFTVDLKAGPAFLQTWLEETDGTTRGAFYVDVRYLQ